MQYASDEYIDTLKSHGFKISMARVGNPYENAMMNFFQDLEARGGLSITDVVATLPYFLEEVYNRKRLHPALGYRSLNDFERLALMRENDGLPRQTLLTLPVQS